MNKQTIRNTIRSKNLNVDVAQRSQHESNIAQTIEQMSEFKDSEVIALFVALSDEISTLETINRWYALGKKVVLPVIDGDSMQFHNYHPDAIKVGKFSIVEPDTTDPRCQTVSPHEIDLMLVPGVAFTESGERLGRGGGYYDRYLSSADFRATTIGICYPHQILTSLPTELHDVSVQKVIWF